jgi:50S ribosomal protein L16 3-hydroxylase
MGPERSARNRVSRHGPLRIVAEGRHLRTAGPLGHRYNRGMPKRAPKAVAPPAATAPRRARTTLLGNRTVPEFLAGFWHKRPLLVRGAVPGFTGAFELPRLFALAQRDDVESRLVVRDGKHWSLTHGPFRRADFKALPARDWTLLVQGVNLHDAAADALLRRFAFLPFARLDDLMVSYAAPGGGVGPHFDSYDVFLLQGSGRRRWKFGRQDDLTLAPGLPVKILQRFAPDEDAVLAPGDMLYLPPHYAHDGVALDACTTWSIGFRAASANELGLSFLDFLRDELDLQGRYADPDLAPTRSPAKIGAAMQRQCARMLSGIRWDRATVARFLGCWL